MEFQFKQVRCPVCFTVFTTASEKRKFCSAACRKRYYGNLSRARMKANPDLKQKSLERLLAWKEAHRKPKEGWLEITII